VVEPRKDATRAEGGDQANQQQQQQQYQHQQQPEEEEQFKDEVGDDENHDAHPYHEARMQPRHETPITAGRGGGGGGGSGADLYSPYNNDVHSVVSKSSAGVLSGKAASSVISKRALEREHAWKLAREAEAEVVQAANRVASRGGAISATGSSNGGGGGGGGGGRRSASEGRRTKSPLPEQSQSQSQPRKVREDKRIPTSPALVKPTAVLGSQFSKFSPSTFVSRFVSFVIVVVIASSNKVYI